MEVLDNMHCINPDKHGKNKFSRTCCSLTGIFRRIERMDYWAYSKYLSNYFQPEVNILWFKIPRSVLGTDTVRARIGWGRVSLSTTCNSLLYLDFSLISGNWKLSRSSNRIKVNVKKMTEGLFKISIKAHVILRKVLCN